MTVVKHTIVYYTVLLYENITGTWGYCINTPWYYNI